MRHDAGAGQASRKEPLLQPTVSWSADMTFGRRYLVTVDLALVNEDETPADWPLPDEEEYTYTCLLDGGGMFDLWPVHDAHVVLHRFGGSYGAAEFVVTPSEPKSGKRTLWLTILNQWGISAGDYELAVEVHVAPADQVTVVDEIKVPAAVSVMAGELAGRPGQGPPDGLDPDSAQEFADILASVDEDTVDIPYGDLPDGRQDSPYTGADREPRPAQRTEPAPPARTIKQFPFQENERKTEDLTPATESLAAATRRDLAAEPHAEPSVPRRRDSRRRAVRLDEFYNVAGLRRSRAGRLHWDMVPLFPPGATRGDRVTFTACCSPSDERGTVFAVLAEPENFSGRGPEIRSVQSAKIPPGMYQVTAELLYPGPGHVRFHGLPAQPREDPRPWQEITATVPRSLPVGGGPAHLIVAIEISAPDRSIVAERLDSVRRLILHVAAEAQDVVCYSLITYGPHSIHFGNREFPEVPVTPLARTVTAETALVELDRLSRSGLAPFGYDRAAQLECVLTDLEGDLTGQEGRPVLVTVGVRPPHPPRVDPGSGIIPCPRRNDWTAPMGRLLAKYPGIRFGSIRDAGGADQLWRMLGSDATALDDYFAPGFARSLGLTSAAARPSAPPIALPLFSG